MGQWLTDCRAKGRGVKFRLRRKKILIFFILYLIYLLYFLYYIL